MSVQSKDSFSQSVIRVIWLILNWCEPIFKIHFPVMLINLLDSFHLPVTLLTWFTHCLCKSDFKVRFCVMKINVHDSLILNVTLSYGLILSSWDLYFLIHSGNLWIVFNDSFSFMVNRWQWFTLVLYESRYEIHSSIGKPVSASRRGSWGNVSSWVIGVST
jgi:hypothetical protein